MKNLCLTVASLLAFTACQRADVTPQPTANCPFCGTWTYAPLNNYIDANFTMYTRRPALPENQYGYVFLPNGKLTVRQNSGWCGTPPIITADYSGNWLKKGDTVYVASEYWGGTHKYRFTYALRGADTLLVRMYY